MKAVLITFDQAHYDNVLAILDRLNCRGFTRVERVQGRGSKTGDPHYGSHAWPAMGSAVITMVEDGVVDSLLKALDRLDKSDEMLGLRAFVWNIEKAI